MGEGNVYLFHSYKLSIRYSLVLFPNDESMYVVPRLGVMSITSNTFFLWFRQEKQEHIFPFS